jgi:hypothetical protein
MLFRSRRKKNRMVTAASRLMRSWRALATAAGVVAALTAASSSVSAKRQQQS